nr:MAG TPA: hypothetical protein [Caudoviricetes sp.]
MTKPSKLSSFIFLWRFRKLRNQLSEIHDHDKALKQIQKLINLIAGYIDVDSSRYDAALYKSCNYEIVSRFGDIYAQLDELSNLVKIAVSGKRIMVSDYETLPKELLVHASKYLGYRNRFALRSSWNTLKGLVDRFTEYHFNIVSEFDDSANQEQYVQKEYANLSKLVGRFLYAIDTMLFAVLKLANANTNDFVGLSGGHHA